MNNKNWTIIIGILVTFTILNYFIFDYASKQESNSNTIPAIDPISIPEPYSTWHFNIKIVDINDTNKNIDSQVNAFLACGLEPSKQTIIPANTIYTTDILCNSVFQIQFGAIPLNNKLQLDVDETATRNGLYLNMIKLHQYDNGTFSFSLGNNQQGDFYSNKPITEYIYFKELK